MTRIGPRRPIVGCGLILLVMLGACSSVAPTAAPSGQRPVAPQPGPVDRRAALPAALSAERQWLQSWFDGTPVVIAPRDGQSITVDVPVEHCFDPGRSSVKPALAAVLDKVAQSMRRLQYSYMPLIAAPEDVGGKRPLAAQRAREMHRHLRSAGVPAARLGKPTVTKAPAVQLRIDVAEP